MPDIGREVPPLRIDSPHWFIGRCAFFEQWHKLPRLDMGANIIIGKLANPQIRQGGVQHCVSIVTGPSASGCVNLLLAGIHKMPACRRADQ
jgi:hypothetical protein